MKVPERYIKCPYCLAFTDPEMETCNRCGRKIPPNIGAYYTPADPAIGSGNFLNAIIQNPPFTADKEYSD